MRTRALAAACGAVLLASGCASIPEAPAPKPLPPAAEGMRLWVNTLSAETDAQKIPEGGTVEESLLPATATALKAAGFTLVFGPQDADASVELASNSGPWVSSVYRTTLTLRTREGEPIEETEFVGGNLSGAISAPGNAVVVAKGIATNLVNQLLSSPGFLAFAQKPRAKRPEPAAPAAAAKDDLKKMMLETLREAQAAPTAAAGPVSDVDEPRGRSAEDPTAFAVVVGVEKYSNDLPDAAFAERDAQAVRKRLLALGYPERNIKFLAGSRAVRSSLEAYLEDWLPRNMKAGGKIFFYFSGHGAPDPSNGQAYLVPWDGDPNFLERTGFPLQRLYADLGALKAKQVVVALDSCFSGAGGRSVLAPGTRPLVARVDMSVGGRPGFVLLAAASAKETASTLDDQGHGAFTYYLLKGLGGAAKGAGGAVTARGLYDYLKPLVQDAAGRQNRDQTPVLEGAADATLVHD